MPVAVDVALRDVVAERAVFVLRASERREELADERKLLTERAQAERELRGGGDERSLGDREALPAKDALFRERRIRRRDGDRERSELLERVRPRGDAAERERVGPRVLRLDVHREIAAKERLGLGEERLRGLADLAGLRREAREVLAAVRDRHGHRESKLRRVRVALDLGPERTPLVARGHVRAALAAPVRNLPAIPVVADARARDALLPEMKPREIVRGRAHGLLRERLGRRERRRVVDHGARDRTRRAIARGRDVHLRLF